jgi:hypothetical protein
MSTQELRQQSQQLIPLILAAGLLIIFAYVAWKIVVTSGQAPRLADVAPSAAPSLAPGAKDYPPQYRGGFDENVRLLALIAIVSPLLTTIVGFYFGHQVGDAKARAVQAQASERDAQIENIANQNPTKSAPDFVQDLKTHGVLKGITL